MYRNPVVSGHISQERPRPPARRRALPVRPAHRLAGHRGPARRHRLAVVHERTIPPPRCPGRRPGGEAVVVKNRHGDGDGFAGRPFPVPSGAPVRRLPPARGFPSVGEFPPVAYAPPVVAPAPVRSFEIPGHAAPVPGKPPVPTGAPGTELALGTPSLVLSHPQLLIRGERDLNRHFPDNPQIQGNRTTVPTPRELHPFRSQSRHTEAQCPLLGQ